MPMPMPSSKPLVTHMFTADPRAHVFEGRIYVYPSHDIEAGVPEDDDGGHFDMRDYHVISMAEIGGGGRTAGRWRTPASVLASTTFPGRGVSSGRTTARPSTGATICTSR